MGRREEWGGGMDGEEGGMERGEGWEEKGWGGGRDGEEGGRGRREGGIVGRDGRREEMGRGDGKGVGKREGYPTHLHSAPYTHTQELLHLFPKYVLYTKLLFY